MGNRRVVTTYETNAPSRYLRVHQIQLTLSVHVLLWNGTDQNAEKVWMPSHLPI